MNGPDVIIIGAMKSATSTLAAQLGAQSGVFLTNPKEPNYFSDDDIYAKGAAWYGGLFAQAHADDIRVEASTHYTKLPTYPATVARLKATGLTPKLIYITRDPVARLISHYIHEWTQGVMTCSLEEALQRHPELVDYSLYGKQMTPWVAAFGADAILRLTMEEMMEDPHSVLARVGDFIGRKDLAWRDDLGRMNVSSERIKRFPMHGLLFDNPVAQTLRRTLVPKALRDRLKAKRQMPVRPELSASARAALETVFAADAKVLNDHFAQDSGLNPAKSKDTA